MIPVYVVNLARSPERRAFMEAGLARAGASARFVAAVDGRARRCAPARLSRSEAALILSHRKVWRAFLREGAAFAVVLEDDARIGEGFAALLGADWGAYAFDLVKLETMGAPVWLSRRGAPVGARALRRLGAEHYGTAGYLVGRAGAQMLLRRVRKLDEPLDHTLFGPRAIFEREIVALQLVPAVIAQERATLAKTLGDADARRLAEAAARRKPAGWRRLAREAGRLINQARRALRFWPAMRRAVVPWR